MMLFQCTKKTKWHFCCFLSPRKKKSLFFLNFLVLYNVLNVNLNNITQYTSFLQKNLYVLQFLILKNTSFYSYSFPSDLTAVHYPESWFSLKLKYILRGLNKEQTLILSCDLSHPFTIPSLSFLYKSSDWLERETYDMFGVWFFNHLNLRKILTDYGFKGSPLLKDFPVFGYKELRYDLERQQLIYTPVISTQKWRNYLFIRQWVK